MSKEIDKEAPDVEKLDGDPIDPNSQGGKALDEYVASMFYQEDDSDGFEKDLEKLAPQEDDFYDRLYAALCNNDLMNIETNKVEGYSWRASGGVVARLYNLHYQTDKDYLYYYCNGNEGLVEEDVEQLLNNVGWTVINTELAGIIAEPDSPRANAIYAIYKMDQTIDPVSGFPYEDDKIKTYFTLYRGAQNDYLVEDGKAYVVTQQKASKEENKQLTQDEKFICMNKIFNYNYYSGDLVYDFEKDGPLKADVPQKGSML